MISLRKMIRLAKQTRLRIYRQERARTNGEYECVGGPLDGEVIKWFPRTPYYMVHGVYREGLDYRLHYYALSPDPAGWKRAR